MKAGAGGVLGGAREVCAGWVVGSVCEWDGWWGRCVSGCRGSGGSMPHLLPYPPPHWGEVGTGGGGGGQWVG